MFLVGCSGFDIYENPNQLNLKNDLRGWRVLPIKDKFHEPTRMIYAEYKIEGGDGEAAIQVHREREQYRRVYINMGRDLGANIEVHRNITPITKTNTTTLYNGKGTQIGHLEREDTEYVDNSYTTISIDFKFIFSNGEIYHDKGYYHKDNFYRLGFGHAVIEKMLVNENVIIQAVGTKSVVGKVKVDLRDFKKAFDRIGYFPNKPAVK